MRSVGITEASAFSMESMFNCSAHFLLMIFFFLEMGYLNLRVVFTRVLKTGYATFKPAPGRLLFVLLREWGALDLYDSVEP